MQTDPRGVDWGSWLRSRPNDVHHQERVIVRLGDGWFCQLCSTGVNGDRADHYGKHMAELDAYEDGNTGPKTDSQRRSEQRRSQREEAIARAAELGEDPFIYAIDGVDENTHHRRRRRRLRHPRGETLDRVRSLLEQGVMPSAIADALRLSDNYTRRLIREIEGPGCSE